MAIFSLSSVWIANLTNADDHSVSPIWASYYEIDLSTFDLDADADGDGLTGRDEAAFGTDPLNGDSVVRPTVRKSGVETFLEWDTIPGALYQIEVGTDLAEWEAFGNPNPGAGTPQSVVIEVQGPKRFFRVRGLTPPDDDGDGLDLLEETFLGTDPDNPDSDGDTFLDGEEAAANANPGDPTKTPAGDIPPEPASVAPPADPGATTNAFLASQFLYTGDNPIQTGVAESAIEGRRAAIMRGKVTDRNGTPLPGVKITILNCPEFGQTLSRADGMFDLVVNGGGRITVRYERNGFLPVQRSLPTGWLNFSHVPDVALTRLDTAVTSVDLTATVGPQLALGSEVSDGEGTRRGVILVNEGTQAEVILPDGSTQAVDNLNVRITEYTVGESGPNAMPGLLPPASAYTYAFELSADESVSKVAGKDVLLSQPVYYYVDNFLEFPVGINAPVGYYDSDRATWVPSESGRVIEVVGEAGGLAELDVDGDGFADSGTALTELRIDDAERKELAVLYDVGDSLWRVALDHFSTWDVNWGVAPPDELTPPKQPVKASGERGPDEPCSDKAGSVIFCQEQILGQSVPVTGTPYKLSYTSDRTKGYRPKYQLNIPLTGDTLPDGLERVVLEIFIAGYEAGGAFAPSPNLSFTFEWDRFDIYGNFLNGATPVTVRIGYVYNSPYAIVGRFGFFPDSTVSALGVPARGELIIQQNYTVTIGGWDETGKGLGGWTFDVHHSYDPMTGILHLGNGSIQSADNLASAVIDTAGGGGATFPPQLGIESRDVLFSRPVGVAVDASGGIYVADEGQHRVLYFNANNVLTRIFGTGTRGFSGDGGPASAAQLSGPRAVVAGRDGSVFIAEAGRVRRVNPDGIIITVAGTGVLESDGDGGPAVNAKVWAHDLAEGPDGSLYIVDLAGYKIRRVDQNGMISTVAGTGVLGFTGDGGPATEAQLKLPIGIDVAEDGSIYIAELARIRRIGTDGIIRTIAGNGSQGSSGDGFDALGARVDPTAIAIAVDGSLYIAETCRIRRLDQKGIISAVAGRDTCGSGGDGGPAAAGQLFNVYALDVGPDSSIYAAELTNHRIRRIAPAYPGFVPGDNPLIASQDGRVVYRFTEAGRHLETIDALTGVVLLEFSYDSVGRLTAFTDAYGNVTSVERNADGNPTAIVVPQGQRTELETDANNFLSKITDSAGQSVEFTYTNGGLMTSAISANGNASIYEYGEAGRLILVVDAAGGSQTLSRTEVGNGHEVTKTSELERATRFRVERFENGDRRLTNTAVDKREAQATISEDGTITATDHDGNVTHIALGPDPRFGMQSPVVTSFERITPGGLTTTGSESRTVTIGSSQSVLGLESMLSLVTINGQTYRRFYDTSSGTVTLRSPLGREGRVMFNDSGRITRTQFGTLTPVDYSYDQKGRLVDILRESGDSARGVTLSYDAAGRVETSTDRLSRVTAFEYDSVGRLMKRTAPGERVTQYTYDAAGNPISITPPGRPQHRFRRSVRGFLTEYSAPDVGNGNEVTRWTHNEDRQLVSLTKPDGKKLTRIYDTSGRLSKVTTPGGQFERSYDALSGKLADVVAPGGEKLSYEYDGGALTGRVWQGTVSGSVQMEYSPAYRVLAEKVNDANLVEFEYDKDNLLIGAGALSLARDLQNGLITRAELDDVITDFSYNEFGAVLSEATSYDGTDILNSEYKLDVLGRLVGKSETFDGETTETIFVYNEAGRLARVDRKYLGITSTATYTYDANGNRLNRTTAGTADLGVYNAQDQMVSYGGSTFDFNANGELVGATDGSGTTNYEYDVLGALMSVRMPDGRRIEYVLDAYHRRIGKKINGDLIQGLLYQDALNPIAELDGNGAIVSRFVYGTRSNVPDYMIRGSKTYRVLVDHLGSPRLVIDTTNGTIVQKVVYDEFGNILDDTNPGFQPFGFAGGIYDRDTKLTHMGAREYGAHSGRWMTKDPALFAGGDENLYGYVANNPQNYVDPGGADHHLDYVFERLGSDKYQRDRACVLGSPTVCARRNDYLKPGESRTITDEHGYTRILDRGVNGDYTDIENSPEGEVLRNQRSLIDPETGDQTIVLGESDVHGKDTLPDFDPTGDVEGAFKDLTGPAGPAENATLTLGKATVGWDFGGDNFGDFLSFTICP